MHVLEIAHFIIQKMSVKVFMIKQGARNCVKHHIVKGNICQAQLFAVFLDLLAVGHKLSRVKGCIKSKLSHAR